MSEKETKRIVTPLFRLSYPWLFEAQPPKKDAQGNPKGEAKFGLQAIFRPSEFDERDRQLWGGVIALANTASIEKFKKPLAELPGNYKRPFHRGDEKPDSGMLPTDIFFNATSSFEPELVRADGKTPITKLDRKNLLYPGCYCRASIGAFGYNKDGGLGVAFGLYNVMFQKDGPRLDNRVEAAEDFRDYAVTDAPAPASSADDSLRAMGL